ncbi:hypothetical protein COCNU_06G001970 [Cocos nucifera]|uniref:Plant thionin family protein n=1 Tax=Cocos nucifera TaxID=13894 RepID=A0A8K0I9T7_COCNU|nr:hypothetical protein COCNU_06G001970 [Cocos nucifera]
MACNNVAPVLFLSLLLVLSTLERIEAGQSCYCECMKKCIPLGMMTIEACRRECDEACRQAGFAGKPPEGLAFCKKLATRRHRSVYGTLH